MAFPSVIVECAFNSILSETSSAQTGYTDITKFVDGLSGTLRGRSYELDEVETGTVSLTLDNSDGRFTPGSPLSPYYPYVKADRRLRIRGKNMQRLNIARAGGQDQTTDGFFRDSAYYLDAVDGVTVRVTEPVTVKHNPVSLGFTGALLDEPYHVEATLKAGATAGTYRVLSWWAPAELGVRSTHSAYVWRVSGTEPTGTLVYLINAYYDANGVEIEKEDGDSNVEWNNPTPSTPTRRVFADLPPGDAAYVIQSLAVTTTATAAQDVTYAVNGIQSEIPTANLVPSISGYYDYAAWQVNATSTDDPGTITQGGTDAATSYVRCTVGMDTAEFYTTVPHLVPGDDYTFAVQVRKSVGAPTILVSADDGRSGELLTSSDTWTTIRHSFTAPRAEHPIKFIPQSVSGGTTVDVRLARCTYRDDNLATATSATDTDVTDWTRPIPIFDGWVERWPIKTTAFSATISITANDRMKKIGEVSMESTLKQTLMTDNPSIVIPFNDDPTDNEGTVSVLGDWPDDAGTSSYAPSQTKFGAGAATFELGGIVGPTDEDALELTQVSLTQGYTLMVPYSYDYTTTPPGTVIKPLPVPKPPPRTYLRKNFYATWSQTYDGTNARRTTPYIYQGVSGFTTEDFGNQRSLVGFNWQAIKAWLKDAIPVNAYFNMCAADWGLYKHGTAYIGWHTYGTAPTTYNTANATERLWKVSRWPRNAWRTTALNIDNVGVVGGVSPVPRLLQLGTMRGISVGWGDGNKETYGTFYGATHPARPFLTILAYMPRLEARTF